jgi:hypothetical protein
MEIVMFLPLCKPATKSDNYSVCGLVARNQQETGARGLIAQFRSIRLLWSAYRELKRNGSST